MKLIGKDTRYLKTCRNTNENASDNGLYHNVMLKNVWNSCVSKHGLALMLNGIQ